ncbi:ArsR/SmtB family transcription factor [Bacillus mycoides]|uniref:ArsR/SmtB family transcription factor n=1 Tax=Bacillus mycoides TaxID=1405 RepID=UPI002E21050D|nr:metalloregulator ArsR/SmtB family transcription factor [Bacillus mycoides]
MLKSFEFDCMYYERPADILRVLGHPMRLVIVRELITKGPLNVSELQKLVCAPQSTVSQQLTKLRFFKIVNYGRRGIEIYYSVHDEDVIQVVKSLGLLEDRG